MDVRYKPSFSRDVREIKSDAELALALFNFLNNIRAAKKIEGILNCKKLDDYVTLYRVKIKLSVKKDYRIGMMIRGNTVWLTRFLHRNKIYEEFP
jgi:mRNA interferase RelE/StbE